MSYANKIHTLAEKHSFTKIPERGIMVLAGVLSGFLHHTNFFRMKMPKKYGKYFDELRKINITLHKHVQNEKEITIKQISLWWYIQVILPIIPKHRCLEIVEELLDENEINEEDYRTICDSIKEANDTADSLDIEQDENSKAIRLKCLCWCNFLKHTKDCIDLFQD